MPQFSKAPVMTVVCFYSFPIEDLTVLKLRCLPLTAALHTDSETRDRNLLEGKIECYTTVQTGFLRL
jgi:hypothetical protein